MRLNELINFVRQIEADQNYSAQKLRRGDPLSDYSNTPSFVRPRVPPEGLGNTQPVLDRGDLVFVLEDREVSLSDLPHDVQVPNPPIDILAYYLPFHLYNSNWGIYLRESGVLCVATILKGSSLNPGDAAFIDSGRSILLKHEHFHFQAEVACARAEVVAGVRMYDAYFIDDYAAAHEEALANAFAYRDLRRQPKALRNRVSEWMKAQGPGYRDFDRWVDSGKFRAGCRRAGQHMLEIMPRSRPSLPEPAEFLFDSMGRLKPPIRVVLDVSLVSVLKPFPKAHGMRVLVHTRDHPLPTSTSRCRPAEILRAISGLASNQWVEISSCHLTSGGAWTRTLQTMAERLMKRLERCTPVLSHGYQRAIEQ